MTPALLIAKAVPVLPDWMLQDVAAPAESCTVPTVEPMLAFSAMPKPWLDAMTGTATSVTEMVMSSVSLPAAFVRETFSV